MTQYKLSFTTGGLLSAEARVMADVYGETQDWERARAEVREQNLLRLRIATSATWPVPG